MRIPIAAALAAALLAACSAPAAAGSELYVFGGVGMTNLGMEAADFGRDIALVLTQEDGLWASEKQTRTGFEGGVGFRYSLPDGILGFGAELRMATRGTEWELQDQLGTNPNLDMRLKLTYIEVPLLLHVTPGAPGATVRPHLVAGPVLGFNSGSDLEFEAAGLDAGSVDLDEVTKDTYFGATLGGGVRIRTSPGSALMLQARAFLGLSSVLDEDEFGYEMQPQDFSLLLGYSFGL